jgi:hypothetical protein
VNVEANGKVERDTAQARELRAIPADDVDVYWKWVDPGVRAIIARSNGAYRFLPEEVYVFLRRKVAQLYVVFFDERPVGWGIVRRLHDAWTNEPFLQSWLGQTDEPGCREYYFRQLEPIARALGCKSIRHGSVRLGFLRKPPTPEWRFVGFEQERVLED